MSVQSHGPLVCWLDGDELAVALAIAAANEGKDKGSPVAYGRLSLSGADGGGRVLHGRHTRGLGLGWHLWNWRTVLLVRVLHVACGLCTKGKATVQASRFHAIILELDADTHGERAKVGCATAQTSGTAPCRTGRSRVRPAARNSTLREPQGAAAGALLGARGVG